jgi:acyl-[acyl-carrier-protein]-phospholipid O-acyltransferase/long-chain-fatty-acid--[acyl-carrier-protein] ligase
MSDQPRRIMLPRHFLRKCRQFLFKKKVADSTGVEMTGGSLLMRTLIFRRILMRNGIAPGEQFIGVLVPPSAGGVLANTAISLMRRVPVNLNYTVTSETLNYCIEQCGIKHVVTSRKFMERFNFKLNAELLYLEDLREQVSTLDKLASVLGTYVLPAAVLERWLGLHKAKWDDLSTIIYTSGSTGLPKGVMLTHSNIGSNVAAIEDTLRLGESDTVCGILPLFHSMGYTVALWAVLCTDVKGAYHFSPLDAKIIGKLCMDHDVTILVSTPTFLRSYMRRCSREEFASVDMVVTGAEKLPTDLLEAFEEHFGIRPMEGYGTTELSPVVSVNVPANRAPGGSMEYQRIGTVGRPVMGVKAKIVDLDTGEDLGIDEPGMLLISGPNVMKGYYKMPEQTAKVMRGEWYVTGDMGMLDAEGFIHITGRLSRFSKIGGEMVPHIRVEELLQRMLTDDEEKVFVAVTAVPDERKGERLIVFHLPTDKTPAQITKELAGQGLPNLWIPGNDSFFEVEEIPLLGTGKLDLQAVREMALERVAGGSAASR